MVPHASYFLAFVSKYTGMDSKDAITKGLKFNECFYVHNYTHTYLQLIESKCTALFLSNNDNGN